MAKGLRNAALLGGAALLAAKMMGGKGKEKSSFADIQDAEAGETLAGKSSGGGDTGVATQRLSDFVGKSGDADKDIGPRMAARRTTTTAQDADAVAAAKYAAQRGRDRAAYLNRGASSTSDTAQKTFADTQDADAGMYQDEQNYANKMKRLEKEQALGRVTPEAYLGPGGALKMLSNVAKGMAGRDRLRTITQPALTNEARKLTSMKKGGAVKASKSVSSASKRGDGCAMRGKTRGKMV